VDIEGQPYTWTDEQKEQAITFLVTKPLKELRDRQSMVAQQLAWAHEHPDRIGEHAIDDLLVMQDLEMAAVMRLSRQ
jgi:hypothetical protein